MSSMQWYHLGSLTAGDSASTDASFQQSTASTTSDTHILTWYGVERSIFDGYEYDGGPRDEWAEFQYRNTDASNQVEWGSTGKYWIRVTIPTGREFCLYFRWNENYPTGWPNYDYIDNFTVNFAPIAEEKEVAPETFKKFLEKCGNDEAYLRMQYRMQKKLMKHTDQIPPWDPRKIEQMNREREAFNSRLKEMKEKDLNYLQERWGVEELPPLTPELLDSIKNRSRCFLESCLSPNELLMYDEEGHIKIPSSKQENVIYVIKKGVHTMIERHVDGAHVEDLCVVPKWSMIPHDDAIAGKVLDVKYNEDEMLKVANHFKKSLAAPH